MFNQFAKIVALQLKAMQAKGDLLTVVLNKEELKSAYLGSFTEGNDPVHITNTVHDCNCCHNFLRDVAGVVVNDNGKLISLWDIEVPAMYKPVVEGLRALVASKREFIPFSCETMKVGAEVTHQMVDGSVTEWNHFYGEVYKKYTQVTGTDISHAVAKAHLLRRAVTELSLTAIDSVLDLIREKNLYRGDEHKAILTDFRLLHVNYNANPSELFIWSNYFKYAARIRSSVIGSLLIDLSKGKLIEQAVKSFESKVAPTNYKRPKALITKAMINIAMETIGKLGVKDSLERRLAVVEDLSINDIIYADKSSTARMRDSVDSLLLEEVVEKTPTKLEDISIDDFISKVVPTMTSCEIAMNQSLSGNIMTITAPKYEDATNIFKWDNNFAWSYAGNVTDAITQRVKNEGGVSNAAVRFSLSWDDRNDLDLALTHNDQKVYFLNKQAFGFCLDIDANAGNIMEEPVENIYLAGEMSDGNYQLCIHNYHARTKASKYQIQLNILGDVITYENLDSLQDGQKDIITFIKKGSEFSIKPSANLKVLSEAVTYSKVNILTISPNYWNGQSIGNKHWFFLLEDEVFPESVRGIYNEYLNQDLAKHKRVFEVLGDKTKCESSASQLSGVGFSSTVRANVTVRVNNHRMYSIKF